MKSSKKRSRAVVTVVACILAVCLVAALVLFSLVNSKVRALQKGATFEFSYNITAQDSASTPALYNILKQVGATSGDVAGLYSPGQLQLYLYPSGGLARAEKLIVGVVLLGIIGVDDALAAEGHGVAGHLLHGHLRVGRSPERPAESRCQQPFGSRQCHFGQRHRFHCPAPGTSGTVCRSHQHSVEACAVT